jgi:hypothetical protein
MTTHQTLRPHRFLTLAALLASGPACGDETAGIGGSATEPMTGGSPTSFPLTDPGDSQHTTGDPTTNIGPSTTDATTGTDGGTTSEASCGNGIVELGEGCDDGPENDVYAACTDACQPNVCGDGKVHVGVEQCDEAAANVDTGYCRSDCQLNICGDGHVLTGLEECDNGANGPTYGGCDEACTVNRCGDGELDVGHEQCDDGPFNGSGEPGEEGMAGCGDDCGFAGLRLFLSSQLFTGDMGSRTGADLACQTMATNAGFSHPERFLAVLADSQGSPNTFLAGDASGLPYIAPSGLILAASYQALIALGPGLGITTTETGEMVSGERVWTNVNGLGGAYLLEPEYTCADWTSADASLLARVGLNAVGPNELMQWQEQHHWVSYAMKECSEAFRIYCVETPAQ